MKICPKCSKTHDKNGLYCSRSCANSRGIRSEETKLKISKGVKSSEKFLKNNNSEETSSARITSYKNAIKVRREKNINRILLTQFELLNWPEKRIKIYHEQDCKCNKCGNNKWMGEDIPLELEHKDGNHFNNERSNVELLCPNCHALTDTWRGRNKKGTRPINSKITDEQLLDALLQNEWNMRKALLQVGLAAKGGNYPRCHQIKKDYFS